MSSKYTKTNLYEKGCNVVSINVMKLLSTLVRPKGMINHAYNPFFVLNVELHSFFKSILVKYLAPLKLSNKSSILEIKLCTSSCTSSLISIVSPETKCMLCTISHFHKSSSRKSLHKIWEFIQQLSHMIHLLRSLYSMHLSLLSHVLLLPLF